MTDSTGNSHSLAELQAIGLAEAEPFDWDTSALANWPNIDPASPIADSAPISTAEPPAAESCQAY